MVILLDIVFVWKYNKSRYGSFVSLDEIMWWNFEENGDLSDEMFHDEKERGTIVYHVFGMMMFTWPVVVNLFVIFIQESEH